MAIVGYDGTEMAEYADVPLRTVCQPLYELGRQAVEMLVGDNPQQQARLLAPELIVRAFSGTPKRGDVRLPRK